MGGYTNILDRTRRSFERHSLTGILAGIALIALTGAAGSLAGEADEILSNRSVVSTSPTDLVEPGSTDAQPTTAGSTDDPPLTRAATKLRIDEMSPTRWLSQFGNVSIGPRH